MPVVGCKAWLTRVACACLWPISLCRSTNSQRSEESLDPNSYHAGAGVLGYVNPLIGTAGLDPNDNGGMIPSVGVPFGMTRWTPQTRENYISQVPYSDADRFIHGFQATHQPAIWMGESGQVVFTPGLDQGEGVKHLFEERALRFRKEDEKSTAYVYEILLDAATTGTRNLNLTEEAARGGPVPGGATGPPDSVVNGTNGRIRKRHNGQYSLGDMPNENFPSVPQNRAPDEYEMGIQVAMTATGHVGHLRFDFVSMTNDAIQERVEPYVFVQASRSNWTGHVQIDEEKREISGSNSQRQDYLIGPYNPQKFRGYFVSRFSAPFASFGTTSAGEMQVNSTDADGKFVGAFVRFDRKVERVEVRTGVSFISVEQARKNLDIEIPDGTSFEATVQNAKSAWLEKLGRVTIKGINQTSPEHDARVIWYTGLFHVLQYPSDFSEPTSTKIGGLRSFYSGYTDSVHTANDSYYQSWSIWDTYRAEHSLLTIFAPERVNSMMRSLLRIADWSGWLPMWANVVETNIMIATNADAVLANALARNFTGFDIQAAWQAVKKDAFVPPGRDEELLFYDREPGTPFEARAGLTAYRNLGWVPNDRWAESASRTLDYAFDDFAAAVVARHAGDNTTAEFLLARSKNYAKIWNNATQFMHARNANGTWAANDDWGWTEGDKWVYTFDVLHDAADGLSSLLNGGRAGMKARLDEHFSGGHNKHSNEPSHHVPYLYSTIGFPSAAAEAVRSVAWHDYNTTSSGLSGNEDLGQMSAWYIFSALGFYPVNPASDEYVVGSPFFEEVRIRLPPGAATGGDVDGDSEERTLIISAPGAPTMPYVAGLKVDGRSVDRPVLKHAEIVRAQLIEFTMSAEPTKWGVLGTS